MSTKHFFSSTEGVVVLGLESLVTRNKHLVLDEANKVVYSRTHARSKVAVISGGGSGHEPAWSGYVGDGMLAAAVNGEVFASPSTKQIMAAIGHVQSDVGIILCITNYTGDNLHFGLAREKALGLGHKVEILRMTDDVALGCNQTKNLGRRGLAGNMFVLKFCGSASEAGLPFEQCFAIGQAVNDNCVTVGSSLDHCHIPGREHHRAIPQNAYVLGMGIHNEPGLHEVDPMPSVEELVAEMLKYCLDPKDADRAFVEFKPDDAVLLLINNFGGMSNFELEALTTVTRRMLKRDWQTVPQREYAQCFETSLNAPGWSISLLNLSGIERATQVTVPKLLQLLDSPTAAPAWPKNGYRDIDTHQTSLQAASQSQTAQDAGPRIHPEPFNRALRQACAACIKAEPDLTRWDIQMGDGDCGEAVVGMCRGIIARLDLDQFKSGRLCDALDEIGEAVEEIGGTLGAIIAIIVASFNANLRKLAADISVLDVAVLRQAAGQALRHLMEYTSARIGGRTVMDALIPFCEIFESSGSLGKAVQATHAGAESTRGMKASFGRATYVGEQQAQAADSPPDPGAMAAAIFLQGLMEGWSTT
ncbi:hypothetical protein AMS68_007992 [Peltaster fructicola]|uniref:Dihydroxyacetone kinase n=1 Tax=Peltaster fructicola TaxID=286661 RepID=A0A6H0Y6E5_9PEZI|nr:hypothetical protein AMS68_007992 [Peltaster fructicola]